MKNPEEFYMTNFGEIMNYPRVSIIILNWNGWKDTIECLESLYRINYPNYDVIVVDNGSEDDSIEKIKEYCEGKIEVNSKFFKYSKENKPIKVFEISEDEAKEGRFNYPLYGKYDVDRRIILIKNKDNYGFAGGNNVGIKFALGVLNSDYVLLLNNDTVVDKRFLDKLINGSKLDKFTAIAGPIIYNYYTNAIHSVGGDIKELRVGTLNYCTPPQEKIYKEVKWIEGSCMLIHRNVFHSIGLFDERFFVYWEETDFLIRAQNRGYKVIVVPNSIIWHKISASLGGNVSSKKTYYMARNRIILARKILKDNKRWLLFNLYNVILITYIFILHCVMKKNVKLFISYLEGIMDGLET
jgi:GT2 family glycosyltransferase